MIGLIADRAKIYRLIEQRIELMLDEGLVEEVKKLLDVGVSLSLIHILLPVSWALSLLPGMVVAERKSLCVESRIILQIIILPD